MKTIESLIWAHCSRQLISSAFYLFNNRNNVFVLIYQTVYKYIIDIMFIVCVEVSRDALDLMNP